MRETREEVRARLVEMEAERGVPGATREEALAVGAYLRGWAPATLLGETGGWVEEA